MEGRQEELQAFLNYTSKNPAGYGQPSCAQTPHANRQRATRSYRSDRTKRSIFRITHFPFYYMIQACASALRTTNHYARIRLIQNNAIAKHIKVRSTCRHKTIGQERSQVRPHIDPGKALCAKGRLFHVREAVAHEARSLHRTKTGRSPSSYPMSTINALHRFLAPLQLSLPATIHISRHWQPKKDSFESNTGTGRSPQLSSLSPTTLIGDRSRFTPQPSNKVLVHN